MPLRPWSVAALVALLAALVLGAGLGRTALFEPDEARHAEIAREMVEASSGWRDWVTPHHDGEPYRNKPAPFYWLLALAYLLFGVDETSARLASAVGGGVVAVATALWGAARWGPRAGLVAGIALLTAPEFVLLGRFSTLDMTMTLWITLGMLAVDRFVRHPGSSLVPAAICGALGLLSKGLVAPGLIALIGLVTLITRRRLALLTPRTLFAAATVFLALVVPWHAAAAAIDPEYLRQLYVDQQWKRAVSAGRRLHARPLLFYVPVLLAGFFPWSALLPATLRRMLRHEQRDDAVVFCASWAGIALLVFGLAQGKVASYLLPAFPPLALLTGRFVGALFDDAPLAGDEMRLLRAGLWGVVAILALAPPVTIAAAAIAYDGALLRPSLWSLILLPFAAAIVRLLRSDRPRVAVTAAGCAGAVLVLAFYHLAAPALMEVRSDATIARALLQADPEQAGVPLVAYHIGSSSMAFYLKRQVLLRDQPEQLRRLLARHGRLFVVTSRRHGAEVEAAGPFVPLFVGPRRSLYGARQPAPQPAPAE